MPIVPAVRNRSVQSIRDENGDGGFQSAGRRYTNKHRCGGLLSKQQMPQEPEKAMVRGGVVAAAGGKRTSGTVDRTEIDVALRDVENDNQGCGLRCHESRLLMRKYRQHHGGALSRDRRPITLVNACSGYTVPTRTRRPRGRRLRCSRISVSRRETCSPAALGSTRMRAAVSLSRYVPAASSQPRRLLRGAAVKPSHLCVKLRVFESHDVGTLLFRDLRLPPATHSTPLRARDPRTADRIS
jgi:hypothetical protein